MSVSTRRPPISTQTMFGPFTMISVMSVRASSGSIGPRPSMSSTSSAARAACSRLLSWARSSLAASSIMAWSWTRSTSRGVAAVMAGSMRFRTAARTCSAAAERDRLAPPSGSRRSIGTVGTGVGTGLEEENGRGARKRNNVFRCLLRDSGSSSPVPFLNVARRCSSTENPVEEGGP